MILCGANPSMLFLTFGRFWLCGISLLSLIALNSCGTAPQGTGGQVHGLVYAEISESIAPSQRKRKIYLPDVTLYLKDISTSALSPKAVTNARGWYAIPHMPAGNYQLCWEAEGYEAGCTPTEQKIPIHSSTATPAPISITPKQPIVTGRVRLSNNLPCFAQEQIFDLDIRTKVTVLDEGGSVVARPVVANTSGEFLIPQLRPGSLRIRAECDGLKAEMPVDGKGTPVTLVIPDTRPKIVSVFAGSTELNVSRAEPGATVPVSVRVKNPGNRPLHYRWFTSDSDGNFKSGDLPTVRWTLPKVSGTNTLYVLVTDESGGHSVGQVSVLTGGSEVFFSGTAVDSGGSPLAGALVSINDRATTSNDRGYFFIQLPAENNPYILTISKDGYALLSHVRFTQFVGARFSLVKSQISTADPQKPINVTESLSDGRTGAEVRIAPNSLVDQEGRTPSGPLSISISSVGLRTPVMRVPGNGGGINASGGRVRLRSYGTIDIQIRDNSGNSYNLAADKTATLRIPVDPAAERANPPPRSAPLWFYDQRTALWHEEGSAELSGHFYEAQIRHLSVIDVGVALNDAACMGLYFDPATVSFPLTLNITIPPALVPTPYTVTGAGTDVIAELPPNEPITLEIGTVEFSKQTVNSGPATPGPANPSPAPGTCGANAYLAVAPTAGIGTEPEPPSPLSPGGFLDFFGLDDQVSADAYYAAIDPTTTAGTGTVSSGGATGSPCGSVNLAQGGTCITGSGTTFSSGGTPFFVPGDIIRAPAGTGQPRTIAQVVDDQHLITFSVLPDPGPPPIPFGSGYEKVGVKTTLTSFKSQNGFTTDQASAVYFNANDLGFGRSMHMWKSAGANPNIFYYVSNYLNVEAARLGTGLIATVAMEHSPSPLGSIAPYTKFYVFNSAGARVNNAKLDGRGQKFVPRLCIICHAGAYVAPTLANQGNMGSRFIGFDLASYGYSDFDTASGRAGQEEAFRQLNQGVLENTNPSVAQQELLRGWYGGGSGIDTPITSTAIAASPAGLVRNANTTTVTCASACGVAPGSIVTIVGSTSVGGTNFDTTSVAANSLGASATSFTFAQTAANDTGGGGLVYVGTQNDGFVPTSSGADSWNSATTPPGSTVPKTLYTDVIRTSCRTCHVNRDAPIDWNRFGGGDLFFDYANTGFQRHGPNIEPILCGLRMMPHAEVTYINFWSNSTSVSNPNRLSELQHAGLDSWSATDPCPVE